MEQNTNRMWWTIGIVALGGMLLTGSIVMADTTVLPKIKEQVVALLKKSDSPYEITQDLTGKYYIIKYTGDKTSIAIPSKIDGKKISYISIAALNKNITSISFAPDFDGTNIFNDDFTYLTPNLKSLSLPSGLKAIESYQSSSLKLDYISVPEGVTAIGNGAFMNTKNIRLPQSLTKFTASDYDYQAGTNFIIPKNMVLSTDRWANTGIYLGGMQDVNQLNNSPYKMQRY